MSDSYTSLFSFIILLCGFFVILISGNLMKNIKGNPFTLQAIILTGLLGAINIVCANDFPRSFMLFYDGKGFFTEDCNRKRAYYFITHWMPLPQPYKESIKQ